jgi:nitrous oxidase accessory protein NosD
MYSYNAHFFVDGRCTNPSISPCPSYINSKFEKLNYGIYATCNASSAAFSVKHSDFTENRRGIYVSGISGATITENNFFV